MPSYKFFVFPRSFFSAIYFIASICLVTSAQAADLRACEKAKLRQLNIEQTARANHGGGKKTARRAGASKSKRSAEQIDEWLWKNCRDYSYELRNLEQQQM